MKVTRKCIRCGKKSKFGSGWVKRGKQKILAGWCSAKCNNLYQGFSGYWQQKHGIKEEELDE